MKHTFEDREDGLAYCLVCGGGESSLPAKCPGRRMTAAEMDAISACDCGGFPHGKHCAAVGAGHVEHTPTTPNGD